MTARNIKALGAALASGIAALALLPTASFAQPAAPAWKITSLAYPTHLPPGDQSGGNVFYIAATNTGAMPATGPITITDTLPDGFTVDTAGPQNVVGGPSEVNVSTGNYPPCNVSGQTVSCTDPGPVAPGRSILLTVPVDNSFSGATTVTNTATVSGGAPSASTSQQAPVSATPAPVGFVPGANGLSASITGPDGSVQTQAGSHPYALTIDFNLTSAGTQGGGALAATEEPRHMRVDLPRGIVVDPQATTTRCTEAELETDLVGGGGCPLTSAIGIVKANLGFWATPGAAVVSPLYNMVPPPGVPAQFGFDAGYLGVYEHITGSVRTGQNYGLSADIDPLLRGYGVLGATVILWGDPSDPSHDASRGDCLKGINAGQSCPTGAVKTPLLSLPSACSGPLTLSAKIDSWLHPGVFSSASAETTDPSGNPVGVTGCEKLGFAPTMDIQPETSVADSPSGLAVDIKVPQSENLGTLAEANLKDVKVTLPKGMAVSPSAANGLGACTPAEIGIDNANEPACPDSSKIGSVEVTTPLLPDKLKGSVYLAQQNANPFHSLLALYVTAEADGALIKLAGKVEPDPATGRLTTTFEDNPELPFSDFKLDFFAGPRAPLVTPPACGTYTTVNSLSPWSGTGAVALSDPFTISDDCSAASGFSPSLSAGVQTAAAGGSSPFTLTLARDRGENVASMDVKLPRGLLAALKGVPLCPDSAAATGACPAASKIGHVTVAAGPGSLPLYVPQAGKAPTAVYLAGPYKGGPYSLVIKVPAQAGPFDLGTVAVRAALYVDPETAQVTVKSDPMPQILKGIPLEYRKVIVNVDRKDFMRSPTSCRPMQVAADVHGAPLGGPVKVTPSGLGIAAATDALAHLTEHFQVGGCGSLPFKPRMGMRLRGRHQRRDGGHPALITTVKEPKHQANIKAVRVALPLSLALDPKNSQHVCDYDKAKAVHGTKAPCSKRTIVGKAVAKTPLLPHKLRAHVYLVQGIRFNKEGERIKTLPTLLVPLRGKDHVAIDLRAKTNVSHKKLLTTFRNVPDAQISSFKLRINGGKRGILVVTHNQNICRGRQVTDATYRGQSGARYTDRVHMKAPCKGVKKARRARRAHKIKRLRRVAHRAARHGHKAKARKALRRIHRLRHAR